MALIKNPDPLTYKSIKKRIKANNGYCLNKPKNSRDNKCPCKDFSEHGICECGLYIDIPDELLGGEDQDV